MLREVIRDGKWPRIDEPSKSRRKKTFNHQQPSMGNMDRDPKKNSQEDGHIFERPSVLLVGIDFG